MASEALDDAKDQVLFQAYLDHPLPWYKEQDWTLEVRDASGAVVAKSLTPESAEALISWAEEHERRFRESIAEATAGRTPTRPPEESEDGG